MAISVLTIPHAGSKLFAGILINLKDEKMFPPVASRDQLIDGWLLDSMKKDIYDLACEWFDEHQVNDLEDMFNMVHDDRMAWSFLRKYERESRSKKKISKHNYS